MKIKQIISIICFICIPLTLIGQPENEKALLKEYDSILQRLTYAKVSGFCFDGVNSILEQKKESTEHSFFVLEPNVYLKVIETSTKKIYYTRSFNFIEHKGKLAINESYQVHPITRINGHWNFIKMGKRLNITLCSGDTCKNIPIPLYKIKGNIINVKDGIFFEFEPALEEAAHNVTIFLNSQAIPSIDIEHEKKLIEEVLNKLKTYLSPKLLQEKIEAVYKIIKKLN